jgi:hypothetical protein
VAARLHSEGLPAGSAVEIDWDYEEDLLQEFLAGSDFESFDGEFW